MVILDKLFGKRSFYLNPITTDIHSHLVPYIDDGSSNMDESIRLITEMHEQGFRRLITTPHIMGDFFKNSPENINNGLSKLRTELKTRNIDVEIDAAAEYYIDEWFLEKIENDEELLTFGDKLILVETSYINKPACFETVIFKLKTKGYKPVLAHPERYTYLYEGFKSYESLFDLDIYMQINLVSLLGYYSPASQAFAKKLFDKKMVHFIGTDCHKMKHLEFTRKVFENEKLVRMIQESGFMNQTV